MDMTLEMHELEAEAEVEVEAKSDHRTWRQPRVRLGRRFDNDNDSPLPLELPLRDRIRLSSLRTAISNGTAPSPALQSSSCGRSHQPNPATSDNIPATFQPCPVPLQSPNSDPIPTVNPSENLPAQPEHAYIKPQRAPFVEFVPTADAPIQAIAYECCNNVKAESTQPQPRKMGLSKSTRISILLAIDGVFFLIELIAGYSVHSLALVADSFHMLNDVLSLCVGLWAVKRASTGRTTMYTYGWQRAETIGALVNGVFLVALCLSIFLEAIQRFVEPQVVTNPKLVLIVGCLGLASNILGLFLFHDHGHGGHSHGGHTHSHDPVKNAEEGHSHSHSHSERTEHVTWSDETTRLMGDEDGNVEDVLPSVRVAGFENSPERKKKSSKSDETGTAAASSEPSSPYKRKSTSGDNKHRRRASFFTGSIDDMPIHPAGRRDEIINASQFDVDQSDTASEEAVDARENEPLNKKSANGKVVGYGGVESRPDSHAAHKHRQPKDPKPTSGHSHDLNMRGVFLHVLGDALGNVGVIITALIIWLSDFKGKYYFDPGVSLVITVIILYTAIPLCKAAARILLQAVPMGMSIDEIKADIEDLEGITSAHHIHVWQLSDTKLVASLHVRISSEIKNAGTESYMRLAREIQQCLREYGIRSSTIQPEFEQEGVSEHHHDHRGERHLNEHGILSPRTSVHKTSSVQSNVGDSEVCMLDSEDAAAVEQRNSHDHDHDHDGHDHDNGKSKNKANHQH